MSLHTYTRLGTHALLFSSWSDCWFPHTTLIYIQPHFTLFCISPCFESLLRFYMSLHAPLNSHQHPTTCSSSVLITSCLPPFHPLINSTPITTTLGVVTWKLGIVLRPSGTLFLALPSLQSVYLRRTNSC